MWSGRQSVTDSSCAAIQCGARARRTNPPMRPITWLLRGVADLRKAGAFVCYRVRIRGPAAGRSANARMWPIFVLGRDPAGVRWPCWGVHWVGPKMPRFLDGIRPPAGCEPRDSPSGCVWCLGGGSVRLTGTYHNSGELRPVPNRRWARRRDSAQPPATTNVAPDYPGWCLLLGRWLFTACVLPEKGRTPGEAMDRPTREPHPN